MRIFLMLLMAFCLLSPLSVNAQTDPVMQKIVKIGQSDNQCMDHLDILCNRFGGRLIGSDAYENASIWAASKFDEWGMEVVMDECSVVYGLAMLDHKLSREGYYIEKAEEEK